VSREFFALTPDRVLESVERSGFQCTGRCQALNSFENRVYDVELEEVDGAPATHPSQNHRVVKFYRPGRWTEAQLLEEHQFIADLVEAEIPAIAPLPFPDGRTLHRMKLPAGEPPIWYTVFPKVGGRAPDELSDDQLRWIGRLLARIHTVGAARTAPSRLTLNPMTYGIANLEFLQSGDFIPVDFSTRFESAVRGIAEISAPWFAATSNHRLHGDCHLSNLLWNQTGAFFLDFDDMLNGPAIQDLWLLLPGRPFGPHRDENAHRQLLMLLEGYESMRHFDHSTFRLIEPLRALRFVHYSAWVARRWEDPAFPAAFPEFGTHRYWNDLTRDLEEQLRIIGA
jgi:Ser/Thr protein kinase RdoA (MazF antagonist)